MVISSLLDQQPRFSYEDISEKNFDMLELLLLHRGTLEETHALAEAASYLFTVGHESFSKILDSKMKERPQEDAVSFGIMTYEALASLVNSLPDRDVHCALGALGEIVTINRCLKDDFASTLAEARDDFTNDLARASYLVGQSAARLCGKDLVDYAVAGAGIMREAEAAIDVG